MIVICGWFPVEDIYGIPTGEKELVSHGIDPNTLEKVTLPNVSPSELGCQYDVELGEYTI